MAVRKPAQPKVKLCGAKTKRGTKCRVPAMANGRCRIHGGASLVGPAHPSYRTGRYSKALPEDLRERYDAGRTAADAIELTEEIGLIDALIYQALDRTREGGTVEAWSRLAELQDERDVATRKRDAAALVRIGDDMREIIRDGAKAAEGFDRAVTLIEQRRRLVDTERRRIVDMRNILTNDQALVLMDRVIQIVTENVNDRAALAAIASGIRAITAGTSSQPS